MSNICRKRLQLKLIEFFSANENKFLAKMIQMCFCGEGEKMTWGSLSRGTLLLLLCGKSKRAMNAAMGLEMIHHASLIVDDIIDGAITRRGNNSLWRIVGSEQALLCSHYLVSHGMQFLGDAGKALPIVSDMVSCEVLARNESISSLEDYLFRAKQKTGLLYGLVGTIAGELQSEKIHDANRLGEGLVVLGIAHQIADDLVDGDESERSDALFLSKECFARDLQQGVLHLLNHDYSMVELRELHASISAEALACIRNEVSETIVEDVTLLGEKIAGIGLHCS